MQGFFASWQNHKRMGEMNDRAASQGLKRLRENSPPSNETAPQRLYTLRKVAEGGKSLRAKAPQQMEQSGISAKRTFRSLQSRPFERAHLHKRLLSRRPR